MEARGQGWSRRRGRLGVRSGHIGFFESLGRCSWFLVNPRDRLQAEPASRLVHFVSDTRPRHVIAQLLSSSRSLRLALSRASLGPSFSARRVDNLPVALSPSLRRRLPASSHPKDPPRIHLAPSSAPFLPSSRGTL